MENNQPHPSTPATLLDQMRARIRTMHYSIRTEEVYTDWVRRLILFHRKRHPQNMGAAEVEAFLSYLANERHVSSSTQNQTKAARALLHELSGTMWLVAALLYGTGMRLLEGLRCA